MTDEQPGARRPVASYRWKVEPLRFVHKRDRAPVATIPDGVVCRRGKLVVVSTLDVAELPDGSGEVGPQWHVSISIDDLRRPRRATDEECERTLRDFDLVGAEEDNHEPGRARHFWLPVDPARRVECECKTTDEVIVEPDGHRWSNPRDATPETCHACRAARLIQGLSCPIHGPRARSSSSG